MSPPLAPAPRGHRCHWDVRHVTPCHMLPHARPSKGGVTSSDPSTGTSTVWDTVTLGHRGVGRVTLCHTMPCASQGNVISSDAGTSTTRTLVPPGHHGMGQVTLCHTVPPVGLSKGDAAPSAPTGDPSVTGTPWCGTCHMMPRAGLSKGDVTSSVPISANAVATRLPQPVPSCHDV